MTLRELAQALSAELVGDNREAEVLGITGLDNAAPGFITYVENERKLAEAEASPALALITPSHLPKSSKPLLRVSNPRLAYAQAISLIMPPGRLPAGIHPSVQIGSRVEIGEGAAIGANAVIGDNAQIGRGAQVYPLVAIGKGVRIGEDSIIYPNVTLYDGVSIGARVTIHGGAVIGSAGFGYAQDGNKHIHLPHIGTVIIEDDVDIGANVTIDRATSGATVIGQGTKIDNLVHIAHNVKIGHNCLLAGQVGISGSVEIGDGVMLAGQAGVIDHIKIGEGAGAGVRAGIMNDVPSGTIVRGMPARPLAEQLRIDAATHHLPQLLRTVRELTQRIAALEMELKGFGSRTTRHGRQAEANRKEGARD